MVVKEFYNLTLPEDMKWLSSHSIRVGACVLLYSSGKYGEFIKFRLRWKSNTFRLNFRNTTLLAAQGSQIPVHQVTLSKNCNHSHMDR
eukprot:7201322-Ditylum_brightwellii.AAC.1